MLTKNILVPKVNVALLRKQRNTLVRALDSYQMNKESRGHIEGVISLLDAMLDIAEGFPNNEL